MMSSTNIAYIIHWNIMHEQYIALIINDILIIQSISIEYHKYNLITNISQYVKNNN